VAPVRGVIDYRVSIIDYQGRNYFPGALVSSLIDYRISVIDYEGRNYFPGLVIVR